MCYSIFEKNFLYLSWLSLLLILESWFLRSWTLNLDSWLETFFLSLELFLILILNSWIVIDSLELFFDWSLIHLSCSLIDLWAFCHHLCHHHCYHQNTFDSPWSFASTISPFLMMTNSEIKKHTLTFS